MDMKIPDRFTYDYILKGTLLAALPLLLASCFTGIESTKKITMTREERTQTLPTAEEKYLADIRADRYTDWLPGKRFLVADARAGILIQPRFPAEAAPLKAGDIISFHDASMRRMPDGSQRPVLTFVSDGGEYLYEGLSGVAARDTVGGTEITGLIDPELVERVDARLRGKTVWTLTTIWQTPEGERLPGRKFIPVTIDSVVPGTMVYPLLVDFHDADGRAGHFLMNLTLTGRESRGFQALFTLEDPRLRHPEITDAVWAAICSATVAEGMTKEECRLSKGNPAETGAGHNYSSTLLVWKYADGTVLYFIDDILRGINSVPT